ncbi:MAG: hypothetical protein WCG10_05380 [Chlamydiota bacterium]
MRVQNLQQGPNRLSQVFNRNNFQNLATNLAHRVQTAVKSVLKHLGSAFKYALFINILNIRWQILVAGPSLPTFLLLHIGTLALLTLGISCVYAYKSSPAVQRPSLPVIQTSLGISEQSLNRQPKNVDIGELIYLANQVDPPIQIQEVLHRFDEVFIGRSPFEILHIDAMGAQIRDITVQMASQRIQSGYIGFITQYKNDRQNYNGKVAEAMEGLLKGIIFELRKPELSIEMKKEALISLSKAADHCAPRRYEEILKVYKTLSSQMETVDQIVLEVNRQIKEDLFVNYYSLSREPVMTLNYIRKTVGAQIGLDINLLNLSDIHIQLNDARSPDNKVHLHKQPAEFLNVFKKIYTPNRLIELMTNYLNNKDREIQNQISQFISNEVEEEIERHLKAGRFTKDQADTLSANIQTTFMDLVHNPDQLMTPMGVKYLLLHFGILTDSKPAHIGRFEAPVVN